MKKLLALLGALLLAGVVQAENATHAGGYTIHHNALTTDSISPQAANAYGIARSTSRGMLNISVIRDKSGTTGTPVTAAITLHASNLMGQPRDDIKLREVREDNAIYYIADFPVAHREHLKFDLDVVPQGETHPLHASFEQEFFTR